MEKPFSVFDIAGRAMSAPAASTPVSGHTTGTTGSGGACLVGRGTRRP